MLWVGATTAGERAQIRELAHPATLRARLAELRERGEAAGDLPRSGEEYLRTETLDEDLRDRF